MNMGEISERMMLDSEVRINDIKRMADDDYLSCGALMFAEYLELYPDRTAVGFSHYIANCAGRKFDNERDQRVYMNQLRYRCEKVG